MRRGEIVNAQEKHLNLKEGFIYIPAYKTMNDRKVPLNKTMLELIPKLLERSKDGYLWTNKYGLKYEDEHSLTTQFSRYAKKINLNKLDKNVIREVIKERIIYERSQNKNKASFISTLEVFYLIL